MCGCLVYCARNVRRDATVDLKFELGKYLTRKNFRSSRAETNRLASVAPFASLSFFGCNLCGGGSVLPVTVIATLRVERVISGSEPSPPPPPRKAVPFDGSQCVECVDRRVLRLQVRARVSGPRCFGRAKSGRIVGPGPWSRVDGGLPDGNGLRCGQRFVGRGPRYLGGHAQHAAWHFDFVAAARKRARPRDGGARASQSHLPGELSQKWRKPR